MAHFNTSNATIQIAFTQLDSGRALYRNLVGTLIAMKLGDGSLDAHFADIKTALGLDSDAEAKSAFTELEAGLGQLNGITSALDQVFNQFRQI